MRTRQVFAQTVTNLFYSFVWELYSASLEGVAFEFKCIILVVEANLIVELHNALVSQKYLSRKLQGFTVLIQRINKVPQLNITIYISKTVVHI